MNVKMSPKGILHNPLFVYAVSYAFYIFTYMLSYFRLIFVYGLFNPYRYMLDQLVLCCVNFYSLICFFGGKRVYIHKDDSNFWWYITIILTVLLQLGHLCFYTDNVFVDVGEMFTLIYPTVCLMLEYVGYKFFNKYKEV